MWKWVEIAMDFVVGLPRTRSGYDSLYVIVNRLTNIAHFITVKTTHTRPPKRIVSAIGMQFILKFWERLYEIMDTYLNFSSAYHPQTDRQIERVNQILEGMLRVCPLPYGRCWDKSLSYVEFSYNNNFQDSWKMAPSEMLYGRRCRTPFVWE
jgi:hypothetical protein